MIRPLGVEVRSRLRSGVAITNISQCVEELVLNSLDAGASCISVRVDIPGFRIQVVDNGCGINAKDLSLVGVRHATSKCHSLKDLEQLNFHGFRGEALASIRDLSGVVEIVSRHKSSYKTLCKIFQNGKPLEVTESCFSRNTGTTVDVHDIFARLPVRKRLISDTLDFERIRHRIASIALIHPEVAFSLLNEATGGKCLQTHKCQSIVSTFSQLFGNSKSKSLKEVFFEHGQFKASGYVSLDSHHSKSLQFLYINGRLILKTRIHKLINAIIGRSALVKMKASVVGEGRSEEKGMPGPQTVRGGDKFAIFVLNIKCCVNEYDISLEPAKTLVEFQDWEGVLRCVERCLEVFLERENLVVKPDSQDVREEDSEEACSTDLGSVGATVRTLSEFEYQTSNEKFGKTIETGKIRRSLHSSTVFRKRKVVIQGCVGDSACGDKLDLDAKVEDLEEDAQDMSNQHQGNFFCETEYSEEQLLSDASLDDSQTVDRPQEAGELIALDVCTLEQPACQQRHFSTMQNNSAFQGTGLSDSSGQQSEMLHADKTNKQCLPSGSTLSQSTSNKSVFDDLNHRSTSSSKGNAVARNACKVIPTFAHNSMHVDAHKLDKESAAFSPPSSRYDKHSKRSVSYGLRFACSDGAREELAPAERWVEDPYPAPNPRPSAFTSCNPIMLRPKPCTRKRTQSTHMSAYTAGYSPSIKKCITLKRTHRNTPRLRFGRMQMSKGDSRDTTDASAEEHATESFDGKKVDLGSDLSELSANTCRSSPLRTNEQPEIATEDTDGDTHSCFSNTFPDFNSGRCISISGVCESAPSVHVVGNDFQVGELLSAQIGKEDFTTHRTEVDRNAEGESEVMCRVECERADVRQKESMTSTLCERISEEGSDERTFEEIKTGTPREKTLVGNVSVKRKEGNETCAPGQETFEGSKDRRQEEGEVSAEGRQAVNQTSFQIMSCVGQTGKVSEASWSSGITRGRPCGAYCGQVVSSLEINDVGCNRRDYYVMNKEDEEASKDSSSTRNPQEVTFGAVRGQCLSDSDVKEMEEGCHRDSLSTRDPQVATGAVCGQTRCSSEVICGVHCRRDSYLTGRTKGCRDSVSATDTEVSSHVVCGQTLYSSEVPRECTQSESSVNKAPIEELEASLQNRSTRICDGVSSRGQASPNPELKASVRSDSESSVARGEEGVYSTVDKEWACTFDTSHGRNLYINLRTGNSSFVSPVELIKPEDSEGVPTRSKDSLKQGLAASWHLPHPAAPHLSFACTPWMPREDRRRFAALSSDGDVDRAANSKAGESQRSLVLEMFDEHLSEQFSDKLCKWTDTNALKEFESKLKDGSTDVSEMLQKWKNPVFAAPGKGIMSLQNPSADRSQVRIHSVIHPYRFSKDMLEELVVVNQLDQKFIICVLTRESSDDGGLVVVVDQHAAHERIRLEKLNADLFEGEPDSHHGKHNLKSSAVSPPLEITLAPNEARLMSSYRTEMERIGLRFTFDPPSESSDEVALVIGIPSVFVERELSEVKRGRSSLARSLVKELITEHIEHLVSASGVTSEIPKVISRIISSQACHGAVRFGESLGIEECEVLIRSLAKCDLPFQCAHGRPSVVPLVDLDLLGKRSAPEEPSPPRLYKLLQPTRPVHM